MTRITGWVLIMLGMVGAIATTLEGGDTTPFWCMAILGMQYRILAKMEDTP